MRKALLITVALVCMASVAVAGTDGALGVFADPGGTTCSIVFPAPNYMNQTWGYLVHTNIVAGASAAEFDLQDISVPNGGCFQNAWPPTYGDLTGVSVGSPGTGVSHGYGGCFTGNKAIASLTSFTFAVQTILCCYVNLIPHPVSGGPTMVDCVAIFPLPTGQGIINTDPSCNCNVATRESTWGGIKALYQE